MKIAKIAGAALLFGVVAGVGFAGVSIARDRLIPSETEMVQPATVQDNGSEDTSNEGAVSKVVDSVMPSVVSITSKTQISNYFFGTQESEGAGSGFILAKTDDVLMIATNNHVVEGATSLSVGFIDESSVSGEVKGTDAANDLAVVAVKLSDISDDTMKQIQIATVGDSDELQLGEQVVAIGNALGYGQSVTSGYVSALNRTLNLSDESGNEVQSTGLIQTDAAINPGNSGGALLNMKGELIGINEAKTSATSSGASVDNIGFAIPIDKAEQSLQELMNLPTREKVDSSEASYIGISGESVPTEVTQAYGIPAGVLVDSVEKNGPADQAGIQKGDIITALDTRSVGIMSQLQSALEYYAAGEKVKIVIQRSDDGKYQEKTLDITLGAAADAQQ